MEYKDHISGLFVFSLENEENRKRITDIARKNIETDETLTTEIYKACKGLQERVDNTVACVDYQLSDDARDTVKMLNLNKEVYRFYGCLAINEMEFYAVIINLLNAKSDWEYNVSARRAFTLVCEIKLNVSKLFGEKRWPLLTKSLSKEETERLGKVKSDINKFHSSDSIGDMIDKIRNKTEAHKDIDFGLQVELIEAVSIKDSWDVIYEFGDLLKQLMDCVKFMLDALENDIKEFCNRHPLA